ncbi:MAG: alpha/beta hydrolase [Ktedonobacteraceae bacterium]|nr:alpha/beta hydrolase [Ktedonobacteraceae bacterium]
MQEVPVVVWGEGEPVVLVHGSGDTDPTFVWSHQRPLAELYQLLVVTRPGYGQRPISERQHVEQDVQEILSLLDHYGGGHLVGFSYGGLITLLVAERQPALIRSLTVIEPPALAVARGNELVEAGYCTSETRL